MNQQEDMEPGLPSWHGFGDRWNALLGGDDGYTKAVDRIWNQGHLVTGSMARVTNVSGLHYYTMTHPRSGPVRIQAHLSHREADGESSLNSLFPCLEGIVNPVCVTRSIPWTMPTEGEVVGRHPGSGVPLSFFDCTYHLFQHTYTRGAVCPFQLAGLAYNINVSPAPHLEEQYDDYAGQLARAHYEQTGTRLQQCHVAAYDTGVLASLSPFQYVSEYMYTGPVLDVESIQTVFSDTPFVRMLVGIPTPKAEDHLYFWIYGAPHLLEGQQVRTGDYLVAFLWFQGCIAR